MNLSHPEQYFAPLLSAMETGGPVRFHAEADSFDGVPSAILYPPNLAIIGTVNMDETTHGLSDKVLDRAFTLKFSFVEMSSYPGWERVTITTVTRALVTRVLTELLEALRPVRLHFGWRVVDDVVDFVCAGERESRGDNVVALLDAAVYAKIVPKFRGGDNENFRAALNQIQQTLHRHGLERSLGRVEELLVDLRNAGSARFWR
jgi:5-methylcytosine-specific restriction enzyme B